MRTSWEAWRDGATRYAHITAESVVVGETSGSGNTDNATSCPHDAFLAGELHGLVRATLGDAALAEMLAAVRASRTDPADVARRRAAAALHKAFMAIPEDPALPRLHADGRTVPGAYGNLGGHKTAVRSRTQTLTFDSLVGWLVPNDADSPRREVRFASHASHAAAWDDWFCVCVAQDVVMVSPSGKVVPRVRTPRLEIGATLRIASCARHPEAWILSYLWLGESGTSSGFLRYDRKRGIVGRAAGR